MRQGGLPNPSGLTVLSNAARYAFTSALRAFFSSDLTADGIVVTAAARAARFGLSAAVVARVSALRPSPIDFAKAGDPPTGVI